MMAAVLASSSSPPTPLSSASPRPRRPLPPPSAMTRPVGGGALPVLALGFRSHHPGTKPVPAAAAAVSKVRALEEEEEVVVVSTSDLEEEVYDFMIGSERPGKFPTREELISAGRVDLAVAIAEHGGWLALGWDLEEEKEERQGFDGEGRDVDRVLLSSDASSSGRTLELDWDEEDAGIQGILCRLEKERNVSYGLRDGNKMSSATDNRGLRRPDIVPNSNRGTSRQSLLKDSNVGHKIHFETLSDNRNGRMDLYSVAGKKSQNQIHMRLQHLQSRLKSTLGLLRSKDAITPPKSQGSSTKQLHELSDALEFQQTEIVKAQDELRSIRAKLAVIEGKTSLEIVEAEKSLEEKQKRINSVETALQMLRTACIVWPNSASDVILTGSFDGWTSQRRMEKSSSGIFSLYLKLYPGRYEIKFIVDGVWRIDPLRPVVNNDGYENNVLVIT